MSQEIFELIYDPKSFPLLFYDSKSQDPITEDNLSLNDHIILGIYNSNEKFDINFERYNITLTNILSGQNDLLKIRAILLIIMIKNSINIMPIFENARYYGNYTKDSQVIKWFWQFFDSLSEDKKFEAL